MREDPDEKCEHQARGKETQSERHRDRRLPFRGAVSVREDAGLGSDEGL